MVTIEIISNCVGHIKGKINKCWENKRKWEIKKNPIPFRSETTSLSSYLNTKIRTVALILNWENNEKTVLVQILIYTITDSDKSVQNRSKEI